MGDNLSKEELIKKYAIYDEIAKTKKKDFRYYFNLLKRAKQEEDDIKKAENNKKKKIKKERKQEAKELFNGFNKINGYIPKYNLIVNELNDYIAFVECFNYNAVKKLIDNMNNYSIKEIQVFTNHTSIFCSLRFENSFKNIVKNKHNSKSIIDKQEEELKKISEQIAEISKDDTNFIHQDLVSVFKIIREKVFRKDTLTDKEIKEIIFNNKKEKKEFQNKINAKKVNIDNDYIKFNFEKTEDDDKDNNIYHKVFGLQLYPSYLYEGYLSEINYLKGVQTCTYIQKIDRLKVENSLNDITSGQLMIIKKYLKDTDRLYLTCFFIHIYGVKKQIENIKNKIVNISNKYNVHLNEFNKQQKRAYDAFLPLMNNKIKCYRQIDNISGVLPQNDELIKNFKCKFLYGKELNSQNNFYFKRSENGIVLSSNNIEKQVFIKKEKDYIVKHEEKEIKSFSFKLQSLKDNYKEDMDLYKMFIDKDFSKSKLNEYQIYILFKAWLNMCLSQYKEKNYIEKNDKENLDAAFEKLEKLFMYKDNIKLNNVKQIVASMEENKIIYNTINTNLGFIDRLFVYLKNHNMKLFEKINEKYEKPTEELKLMLAGIYKLILTTIDSYDKNNEYIYVSHIEEIVYTLDILFDYFFNNKFKNKYMFYSNNDFLLLNDQYVAKKLFEAKYINIIDVASSDLVKINDYVYLSNSDITHLNNKVYKACRLITNICEFNYYIEKKVRENEI